MRHQSGGNMIAPRPVNPRFTQVIETVGIGLRLALESWRHSLPPLVAPALRTAAPSPGSGRFQSCWSGRNIARAALA